MRDEFLAAFARGTGFALDELEIQGKFKAPAMLRITIIHDSQGPVLKLEGKLLAAWSDELRSACTELARQTRRPRLDLAHLSYADAVGAELLESLRREGFGLVDCSPYVSTVLKMETP